MRDTVTTQDGVEVSVDLYRRRPREAVVVICPGFFQSKGTRTFRYLARSIAKGRDVVAMDFRGHGRSSGVYTFSAQEHADVSAVLEWVRRRYARIGVLAFSLGAASAINCLSRERQKVHSLVAVSAPCAFEQIEFKFWTPEAMRTGLVGLEPGAGCRLGNPLLEKERPLDTVRTLGQLPKLFIHGTGDVIVAEHHSHRLFAAAPQPKRLEIIEGGSHAEALFRDDPQRFRELVHTWFAQTLDAPA